MLFANVKQLCKERGITIRDIEENAKVGKNTIYKWKNDNANVKNIKAVADYLGVTVDELLSDRTA